MTDKTRHTRFHGRVGDTDRLCDAPGCTEAGEFRAPPPYGQRSDGPPEWRWLCLDHVRAFNKAFNFFAGMSPEEIYAAQTPYAGWERETRAFAANAESPPPRWADYADPLDAIGARYAAHRRPIKPRAEAERDKALEVLELGPDASTHEIRKAYARLVRRYHPDHNGGDRQYEKALQRVVAAYTQLKQSASASRSTAKS